MHLDPPYGIDLDKANLGFNQTREIYEDTEETYFNFLKSFLANRSKIMAKSSHLMLWFSMKHYQKTLELFASDAPDITIDPFPLIWHKSDGAGVAPDYLRLPKRTYETAFFCYTGDKKVVATNNASMAAPPKRKDFSSCQRKANRSPRAFLQNDPQQRHKVA